MLNSNSFSPKKLGLMKRITVPKNVDPVEHVRTLPFFSRPPTSQPYWYVPIVWQPDWTLARDEIVSLNVIMNDNAT